MSRKSINLPTVIGDILSISGVPFAGTAGQLISDTINSWLDEGEYILLDEVRKGHFEQVDESQIHHAIPSIIRYQRACFEGTARLNLRIMAKAITGTLSDSNQLHPSEFLSFVDLIASLRREEIILLAEIYKADISIKNQPDVEEESNGHEIWTSVLQSIVPRIFENEDDMYSTAIALGRTGLLISQATWARPYYIPSSYLHRIIRMVSFDAAIIEDDT